MVYGCAGAGGSGGGCLICFDVIFAFARLHFRPFTFISLRRFRFLRFHSFRFLFVPFHFSFISSIRSVYFQRTRECKIY